MGIQQIPDQIRKAPTQGLRAFFSGIGRILMSADRPQAGSAGAGASSADGSDPGTASLTPGASTSLASAPPASRRASTRKSRQAPAPVQNRWRSLDQTGNVRLLSGEDLDDDADSVAPPASSVSPAAAPATASAAPASAATASAAPASAALPLANYDSLSLASIRARLRGLDVPQLRTLLAYESANSERTDVLGMLERRIEKLESGQ
jgi:hypothetical protein